MSDLPEWRKALAPFPVLPWLHFMSHVRDEVNPLAADDHLKEVIQQLQLMGEVIYLKGDMCDLVILDPQWLCHEVCGLLLSDDFVAKSRVTGSYSLEDFQLAVPHWEAIELLPILEAIGVCTRCQVDNEIEYEFPCFNGLCAPVDVWSADDRRFDDSVYGGVRLTITDDDEGLFSLMFPRIQSCLRRFANRKPLCELCQWKGGSKMSLEFHDEDEQGVLEAIIELNEPEDFVDVKIRASKSKGKEAFFLQEEVLGTVDQVLLEMSPGLAVDKNVISSREMFTHVQNPHVWTGFEIVNALISGEGGFEGVALNNPNLEQAEPILDLICFSSSQVRP